MQRFRIIKSSLLVLIFTVFSSPLLALECKNIVLVTNLFLQAHLSVHKFDEQLSERTLNTFFTNLDPGKVYFLKKDIDGFLNQYKKTLPSLINKGDCSAIDDVFKVYVQRVQENNKVIDGLIDAKHNFNVEEYLNLDRKTEVFATDMKESTERWRKRVKFQFMQLMNTIKKEGEVRAKLHKRFDLAHKRIKKMGSSEVYEIFIKSFSNSLDPHTDYLTAGDLEEFNIHTRLYLEGIGAMLRSEYGITSIHSLVPGGSAQKSGLVKAGDKIVAVAQWNEAPIDVIDMDLKDVVKLVRGPRGSKVKLTLRRENQQFFAVLTREKVELPDQAAKSRIYELKGVDPKNTANVKTFKVGFIDLPSFYRDFEARSARQKDFRSSTHDVEMEIQKLVAQNMDLLILDIRSNGGGSLEEGVDIGGLFLGQGPIVQQLKKGNKPQIHKYEKDPVYKGPLILMINQQSASASEILAGALKNYDRALLVGGQHTFGKGTVQIVDKLDSSLGAMKVTIAKFYTPSGSSTQKMGVSSDIALPSVVDFYDIGERFYDYALEWDEIKAAPHSDYKMAKPYLTELKLKSELRLKGNADYKKVFDAIKEYKEKEKDRNRISLKMDKKKEKELKDLEEEEERDLDVYNKVPKLIDDLHLQETLRIAGDYIQLLKKESPAPMTLVELEKEKAEKQKIEAEKKAKEKKKVITKKRASN